MDKILVELKNPPCCGDCVFMYFDDFTKCCRHPNAAFNDIEDYHRRPHWCPLNDAYNGVVRLNDYVEEE